MKLQVRFIVITLKIGGNCLKIDLVKLKQFIKITWLIEIAKKQIPERNIKDISKNKN